MKLEVFLRPGRLKEAWDCLAAVWEHDFQRLVVDCWVDSWWLFSLDFAQLVSYRVDKNYVDVDGGEER